MSVIRMALIGALLAATALPATDVGTAAVNQQDGAQTRPRLIVMFVVDQMSAIGLAGHGGTVVTWTDDLSASSVTSRAFSPTPIEAVRDFLHHAPYLADAKKTWLLSAPEDSYRYPGASAFARPPATQTSLFPHRFPQRLNERPRSSRPGIEADRDQFDPVRAIARFHCAILVGNF